VDQRNITLIWAAGLGLIILVYIMGPDSFLAGVWGVLDRIEASFHGILGFLGAQAFDVIRAAAIGIYLLFLVLCVLCFRRGLKSVGACVFVTLGMLVLVWRPDDNYTISSTRWLMSLTLSVIGAVVMTQRLAIPPTRRP
jgi:hypothetical protein